MRKRLGIIGLGLLGGALAERFRERDWEVLGFDLAPACRARAEAAGVRVMANSNQVVTDARSVLLSLPQGTAVANVLAEILPALTPQHVILDTTTAEPSETEQFAVTTAAEGASYVDATVAGSSVQARAGEVLVMAGGTEAAFQAVEPILKVFAQHAVHVGGHGAGSRYKLVHNLMLGLSRAALAESFTLARALKLDEARVLEILKASPAAYSRVMDTKGPKMIEADFRTQATIRQHLKDVRLMLTAAEETQTNLPLSQEHARLLQSLVDRGLSELDNSAIIRAYEKDEASNTERDA